MTAPRLSAEGLSAGYGRRAVLRELSLAIRPGAVTALVGPNGCGKSTLLKALARLMRPSGGAALLDGADVARMGSRAVARRLAILPQGAGAPEALTVRGLVEQGRYPHVGPFGAFGAADRAAVAEALALTGMEGLADRPLDALSGGERQRAWIAMALAQGAPLLLLDEPTTYLDVAHQVETLDLVRRLNAERGTTIVMVLHDLNQAARWADRMVALKDGRVVAEGAPAAVLTEALLREVWGIEATVVADPVSGTPAFFPGRARPASRRAV